MGVKKNVLINEDKIIFGYQKMIKTKNDFNINLYGNGEASKKIINKLSGLFVIKEKKLLTNGFMVYHWTHTVKQNEVK
jgi:hypothetical protein